MKITLLCSQSKNCASDWMRRGVCPTRNPGVEQLAQPALHCEALSSERDRPQSMKSAEVHNRYATEIPARRCREMQW